MMGGGRGELVDSGASESPKSQLGRCGGRPIRGVRDKIRSDRQAQCEFSSFTSETETEWPLLLHPQSSSHRDSLNLYIDAI